MKILNTEIIINTSSEKIWNILMYFKLEEIDMNRTRFIHGEKISGLFSNLLLSMIEKNTLKGFNSLNVALKKEAEQK